MSRYTDVLPLAGTYNTRLASTAKDRRFKNVVFELGESPTGEKIISVIKRPGLAVNDADATGAGRGLYQWNGNLYKVVGTILYKNSTAIKSDLTNSTGLVQWTEQHMTDLLVFRDGNKIVTVTTTDTVTEQTDAQIPTGLVPGIVYLNQWIFVMTSDGLIYNCDLDDITNWTAGNFVNAAIEPDDGKAIFKHHDYVGALGDWTLQFFWDASNPTGSPLKPVDGSTDAIGCVSGNSVVTHEDKTFWVSKSTLGGVKISKLEKMQITTVSTPSIERLIQSDTTNLDTCRAFGMDLAGHFLYIVTFPTLAVTLVYDDAVGLWGEWTSDPSVESYFTGIAYAYKDGEHFILDELNGDDYKISIGTYQDAGGDINVEVVTGIWRGPQGFESNKNKFINRLTLLGDEQTSTSNVTLQITTDDYQNYSTARTVDMSKTNPCATQFGKAAGMAVRLQHTANTPFRAYGIEIDYTQGSNQGGNI